MVLTDASLTGGRPLLEVLGAAVDGGARAILLREKHLPRPERQALAAAVSALLQPHGGVLLVASDPAIPADGVHLAAADAFPLGLPALCGRSCHSRAEVAAAAAQGCHYATLSPVFATASKPGYGPLLGPAALAGHPLPVWALGGVDAGNTGACLRAGAAGVAVMGGVMRAPDPAAAVAELCAAVTAAGAVQP
ncbi:MAG TPA: thiamine phosphate synthase [Acidimicrobiales bacterium]|nr:thiamine phosphate synthase [Acidimicrobiales bacterium]